MSRISRLRRKLRKRLRERDRQNKLYKHGRKRGHAKAGHRDAHAVRFLRRLLGKVIRRQGGPTVMYDSVTLSEIPRNAKAVAGYVGGSWPTFDLLRTEFPKAKRLSIAVNAGENAECLDIETGDATISEAAAWVQRQLSRGIKKPVVYTSASNGDALVGALKTAGISRKTYRLWTAHYTFHPHLCGTGCGYLSSTVADATQWTDNAHGRNLDQSLLSKEFFI